MQLKDLNILDFGDKIGMTGAVFSHNDGRIFLAMFPEQPNQSRDRIEPLKMDLEDWKTLLHQLDVQDVLATVKDATTGELVKAILRKSQNHRAARLMVRLQARPLPLPLLWQGRGAAHGRPPHPLGRRRPQHRGEPGRCL